MGRKPCGECRATFASSKWDTPADRERKKHGPPCAACLPRLHPDNATAYAIYLQCSGQLILSPMGGALDISIPAVKIVMDLKGIPDQDQDEILEQVQTLAGRVIREQALAAEARREADKRDRTGRR